MSDGKQALDLTVRFEGFVVRREGWGREAEGAPEVEAVVGPDMNTGWVLLYNRPRLGGTTPKATCGTHAGRIESSAGLQESVRGRSGRRVQAPSASSCCLLMGPAIDGR